MTSVLSGFMALYLLLLSLQLVAMTAYEFKNEANRDLILFRTRIPATLDGMERKVVYLNKLVDRISYVRDKILAGDEAEQLIEKAVSEVERDKRDTEYAINAEKAAITDPTSESPDTTAITTDSAAANLDNEAREILKKYETNANLMDASDAEKIKSWLPTQPKAAWWYKPARHSPMKLCKRFINDAIKVYAWPSNFNFPSLLAKNGNNLSLSRTEMTVLLTSGIDKIEGKLKKDPKMELKDLQKEWEMRLELVEKFTADTSDAAVISERLQAFERVILTLLISPDSIDNETTKATLLKKWLLTNQMMYAVDGVSGQIDLVKSLEAYGLDGGFPLTDFVLPVPRLQPIDDEVEVDTRRYVTSKGKDYMNVLWGKMFHDRSKQSAAAAEITETKSTDTKITDTKSTDAKSTDAKSAPNAATAAASNPPKATEPVPKKRGWLW